MGFLLDTNVLSAYIKGERRTAAKFIQYGGRLYLSAVTLAEVSVWTRLTNRKAKQSDLDAVLPTLTVLPLDEPIALRFAAVSAGLRNAGAPLPTADLLIAATALHHGLTMVTANRRHFDPVPGLAVEDWTAA